jgi:competence protein ComEC
MLYPFIFVFIFISIGIVASKFFHFKIFIIIPLLFLTASLLFKRELGIILMALGLILFGYSISLKDNSDIKPKRDITIECVVNSIPKIYPEFIKFGCKVENSNYLALKNKDIKIKLLTKEGYKTDIFYRTKVKLSGNLYVFNNNLYFRAKNYVILSQLKIFSYIWDLRKHLIEKYREKTNNNDLFALGSALIFGEKSFLSDNLREIYIKSGLIHLLAISGLHVGMLILVLVILLYPLGKRISYSLIATILVFYPLFTGLQPPVLRASLMGILVLLGKLKNFQINSLNILFFVGSVIVVISPEMLFSPSFQLSFIAVLGIILGLSIFNITGNSLLELVFASIWVSFVAMLFTTPIVMYYFGQFAPVSIIATPIASLPLYPYIFLSVLNIITGFSIDFLVHIMNKFGELFLSLSIFFSNMDFYLIGFSPKLIYVIVFLLTLIWIFIWQGNLILRLTLIFLSTAVFMFLSYSKEVKDYVVYKIRSGYIVKFDKNKCLLYQRRFNQFVLNKLNKLNCKERIFVFNPRSKKQIPDGFDKYIPLNKEFNKIVFQRVGRKILIKINGKFIKNSEIKVLE